MPGLDGTISLDDLKKANEEGEDILSVNNEAEEQEEIEEEEAGEGESAEDNDADESEGEESEDWMKSHDDGEGEDDPKPIDNSAAASIRRKYQAPLKEAKSEIEKLRQENEELRNKKPAEQIAPLTDKPKRDAFENEEDYFEALTDYKLELRDKKNQTQSAATEQQQRAQRDLEVINNDVDNHYVRAAELTEKSGIKPEVYQAADMKVREAVENKFPGAGDMIIDKLISTLGKGSEKVFYNLGVNNTRLAEFMDSLDKDQGLSAAAYLGELKTSLSARKKRESQAPAPGSDVSGDASGASMADQLHKQYKKAHKSKDGQKAFNLKRKAKADGIDTSGW